MQSLAERHLLTVHEAGSRNQVVNKSIKFTAGVVLICLIPYLHVGKCVCVGIFPKKNG